MATSIPTHNLGEVIDAVKAYMKNDDISTRQLMKYIKGPCMLHLQNIVIRWMGKSIYAVFH